MQNNVFHSEEEILLREELNHHDQKSSSVIKSILNLCDLFLVGPRLSRKLGPHMSEKVEEDIWGKRRFASSVHSDRFIS